MPFRLRAASDRPTLQPVRTPDGGPWTVWAHVPYHLTLGEAADPACLDALPREVFERWGLREGLLTFRNHVGRLRVAGGEVRVRSRTLDDYEPMLADLTRAIAHLPFAFRTPTGLPYEPDSDVDSPVLYHRWLMLRHWLLGDAETAPMAGDFGRVVHDPHRRLVRELERRDVARATGVGPATLLGLVGPGAALMRLPADSPVRGTPLARALAARSGQALFPAEVTATRVAIDVDTAENRFVKHVLAAAAELNRAFLVRLNARATCAHSGLLAEARAFEGAIAEMRADALWADVGQLTHFPAQSTVLARREGYRGFLQGYLRLQAGVRYPVARDDLTRILEIKDVAKLYEYWCYFQVAAAVEAVLGPPLEALVLAQDELAATMRQQTVLRWAGATLTYDRTFPGGVPGGSYSVELRPDIMLEVGAARFVFDAKFRLDDVQWVGGEPVYADATWKSEDLHKMHAYKEAIAGVRSAFVLYPGLAGPGTFFGDGSGEPHRGVGAFSLRPGTMDVGPLPGLIAALVSGGPPESQGRSLGA